LLDTGGYFSPVEIRAQARGRILADFLQYPEMSYLPGMKTVKKFRVPGTDIARVKKIVIVIHRCRQRPSNFINIGIFL
jgi:hypothetical protein